MKATNNNSNQKNVVNGVICNTALVEKETEKAYLLSFCVEVYSAQLTIKKQWMPKSQINVEKTEEGKIYFTCKNNWILNAKVKDYCKFVCETFANVSNSIKLYMSEANNENVSFCWA